MAEPNTRSSILTYNDTFKMFVYMHGGGIESGIKEDAKAVAEYVASQGIAFVSINYRTYPQAVFPQFIFDAAEAVNWIHNNIGEHGTCAGIYVGGSSADGYLSMMLCFDEKYLLSNHYEQTQLAIATLKHFGYDESKIYYQLMRGSHCYYSGTEEFGKMIYEFVKETEA